jgi:2-oxoglutarate ferredoxin oxidoreductase subunit beta
MSIVYKKSKGLTDAELSFCPGCTHGTVHKLVAEVLVELDVLGKSVGVAPVGCSALSYDFFACDMHQAAHGRAPAVATGIKRTNPDLVTWTYQGDGDLASIGTAEIIHAAHRGENITTIFINNAIYGMTGGQMAPTTLIGQKTTTSPYGRDEKHAGKPLKMAEMLATIDGAKFVERVSVDSPANIRKAKKAIKKHLKCRLMVMDSE